MEHRRSGAAILLTLLSLLLLLQPLKAAAETASGGRDRRTVRVGISETNSAQADTPTDVTVAFEKGYIQAVAGYADWDCVFVYAPWADCLEQLRTGEVDVLLDVSKTEERLAYYDFSAESMGTEMCYMFGRAGGSLQYNDFAAFDGIAVGYEDGSTILGSFRDFSEDQGFSFSGVPYANGAEMFAALDAGEVDAVIQTSYFYTPAGHVILAKCDPSPIYIATSKTKPELIGELDDAMAQLLSYSPNFNAEIYQYYFGDSVSQVVGYTDGEKAYLASHPVVDVYYETNWEPFEYEENGRAEGITPDVLRAVGADTGITFRFVLLSSTKDVYQNLNGAEQDTVMAVSYDYVWANDHDLLVTQPYISGTVMRVMKTAGSSPASVAVVKDGYLAHQIQENYPELRTVEYLTFRECMDAVASGAADCTFLNYYQASNYRYRSAYEDLVYQPEEKIVQNIALGVTKTSDPALYGILCKSLLRLSADTLPNIMSRDSVQEQPLTLSLLLHHYPAQTIGGFALLFGIAAFLVFSLATSAVRKRKNKVLAAAKQQADAANAAKSEFLSRMSHDMRTPLNGIIGMTYLAGRQQNPPQTKDCLDKIDTSSKFLLGLINDVLDMSKAESGVIELHPEPYDPEEFLRYLDAVIRPLCEDKGIRFVVDTKTVRDAVPLADALRIEQVFFNLLSNAVKFTPRGGTVTFRLREFRESAERIRIEAEVADTGIGMSEEFQKILFEPFTQEKRAETPELHGTGLGLSIVKKLLDLMGSTISVESRVGQGTVFRLQGVFGCVPAGAAERKPRTGAGAADDRALQGRRVLVCEDHPLNQQISKALLEAKGMQADIAADGAQGLQMFRASAVHGYDVLLMDIRMPVMDGYAAAKAIRALDRADAKTVPILAMTADAFADDVQKCTAAGMNGHIAKPIDPAVLYAALGTALSAENGGRQS